MLTLIQRDDCTLCDEAWEILNQAGVRNFETIFIDDNNELEQRYGQLIPVLRFSHSELLWPFTAEQVKLWLKALQKV